MRRKGIDGEGEIFESHRQRSLPGYIQKGEGKVSDRELPQKGTIDGHGVSLSFWRFEGTRDWKVSGIGLFDSEPSPKGIQGLV